MRPLSHFGSLVAALAAGLALTVAGGVRYLASAPTIPARDVAAHGTLTIKDSRLHNNPSRGFFTAGYPGIFYQSSGPRS